MQFLSDALYDGGRDYLKIAITAPIMYLTVILLIRLTGKRATSQMNSFDWIVTVAIGSLTASGIILDSVTVSEAVFAIILLLLFQWTLTGTMVRSSHVRNLIQAEPTLLVHEGRYLERPMIAERITSDEIMAALRENGLVNVNEAQWVILETDASFSVIPKERGHFENADFPTVIGFPPQGGDSSGATA